MSQIRSPFGAFSSPDPGVDVHDQQKLMHIVTEAGGVFLTVPFFFYASRRLPTADERKAAFWFGVGALVVDGFLLVRYLTGTTGKPIL